MSEVSCLCLKSVVYSRYLKSVVYWDIWSQLSSEMSDLQTDVSLLQLPRVGDPGPAGVGPAVPLGDGLDDQSVRLYHVPLSWEQEELDKRLCYRTTLQVEPGQRYGRCKILMFEELFIVTEYHAWHTSMIVLVGSRICCGRLEVTIKTYRRTVDRSVMIELHWEPCHAS